MIGFAAERLTEMKNGGRDRGAPWPAGAHRKRRQPSGQNRTKPTDGAMPTLLAARMASAACLRAVAEKEIRLRTISQGRRRNKASGHRNADGMGQVYAMQFVARGIQVRLHAP
jgi:hypothetical protein